MLLENIMFVIWIMQISCEVDKRIITSRKYSKYRVKLTIVNGEPVEKWQVPYLVSIKEPIAQKKKAEEKYWANLCGGSIINKDGRLLTAAHCFEGNEFLYAKRPYLLRAVSGSPKTDLIHSGASGISDSGVQWRQIKKAILHNHFHFPDNDIALAFVDYPWDFDRGVQAIALPTMTTDLLGSCYSAGYGKVGHETEDKTSEILLLAKIEPMSKFMCAMVWDLKMDKFICTNSKLTDVSEGDSGSPLICESKVERAGKVLTGVVSGKSYDKTTLYTRVSSYLDWIEHPNPATDASTTLHSHLHWVIIITSYCLYIQFIFLFN